MCGIRKKKMKNELQMGHDFRMDCHNNCPRPDNKVYPEIYKIKGEIQA